MTEKNYGALAAKGSLEDKAANDPELQAKIREGRAKADRDLDAMEQWAAGGFSGGNIPDEVPS